MNSRRLFISNLVKSAGVLPLIPALAATPQTGTEWRGFTDWEDVRKQFYLKEGQVYFNNGTMGPTPAYTLDKMISHLTHYAIHGAEVDYKNGSGPELLTGYFDYVPLRKQLAGLINADYREISLIQNATFGMNYVANGLDLKKGDEIINTDQEHGGGFAAWQLLAKRKGCVYKQARLPQPVNDPQQVIAAIMSQVTKKTKVIAIPHIVSVYGTILPVKEICALARDRGIFTIIDGAQSVGQIPVDMQDLGCDAYYTSLHKWMLAPAGNGLLYIRKDQVSKVWSTIASYNWDHQDDHGFRLMQNGTGNPGVLIGLEAALVFFDQIGADNWFGRIRHLGAYLRDQLADLSHVIINSSTNPEMTAGMCNYTVKGMSGPEVQKYLWEKGKLQPRSVGTEQVRHCVHIYNSEKEIDYAVRLIKQLA